MLTGLFFDDSQDCHEERLYIYQKIHIIVLSELKEVLLMENLSSIRIFGFVANWSPFLLALIVFFIVVYFLLTKLWYKDIEGGRPLKVSEGVFFVAAMIILYAMKGSPVNILAHISFSFHMVQMAFVYLLMAPMMYFAIPDYLQKAFVKLPIAKQVFKIGKKPLLALILFVGVFSVYHIPVVLDFLKTEPTMHTSFEVLLFILALLMWYPMFNKVEPQEVHMGGLWKILYIFGIGMLLTPACGLIIFATTPMYASYTDGDAWLKAMELCVPVGVLNGLEGSSALSGPQYFLNSTTLADQQTGGVIMKILQEVFFSAMLVYIFVRWFREERSNPEETTRKDLERVQKQRELEKLYR